MGLGFVLSFGYWCTDFLIVQRRRHMRRRGIGDAENELMSQAMVKIRVGEHLTQVAADGNGPVSALNAAHAGLPVMVNSRKSLSASRAVGTNEYA